MPFVFSAGATAPLVFVETFEASHENTADTMGMRNSPKVCQLNGTEGSVINLMLGVAARNQPEEGKSAL